MKVGAIVAGKYRILRKLGEGGMGSVWLAKNEVTERELAIKFLHETSDRPHTADQLSRFFQEARVAGKLRHPSIVEIFDAGTEPTLKNAPYLVMELLDGIGLEQAIQRASALPLGISLEIMTDVCRALALAHDKGIIHRDLKPSNVYLHKSGSGALVPKVLDFGISKVLVDESTGKQVTGMTRTGAVLGSPLYMSPEQAAGDKSIDARSDVHALGVLLWECLVGRPPFIADTYGLLLVEIIQGDRPNLGSVLAGVPPDVAELVGRAIARDRNLRQRDAGVLAKELEAALERLGHSPVLSTRDGAERFFALVGGEGASRAFEGTTTTAALELPTPAPEAPAPAQSAQQDPPTAPLRPLDQAPPVSRVPGQRSPLPLAGVVAGVVLLAGAGVFFAMRSSPEQGAPSAEPAGPATAGAVATATASPEPSVAPLLSAQAPPPSAGVVEPPPKKPAVVAAKPRPPEAQPKPKPTAPPVHHGVTSSGL